ncbi:MAG: GNAT family N-acetyltransferase, partial [Terriglobales bacterium]
GVPRQSSGGRATSPPSFDPRFRAAGPGLLFIYHLLDWCRQRGDATLEMYANGDEFEKRRWCNAFTRLHRLWLFAPTLRGRALCLGSRTLCLR